MGMQLKQMVAVVAVALAMGACSDGDSKESCQPDKGFCEQNTVRMCTNDGTNSVLVEVCESSCMAGKCVGFAKGDAVEEATTQPPADCCAEAGRLPSEVEVQEIAPPFDGCISQCEEGEFHCSGVKVLHKCVLQDDGCWGYDEGEPCNDENECTDDACAAEKGCVAADNKEPCDDGEECTEGDKCDSGQCQPGEWTCGCQEDGDCAEEEDDDLCNGTLQCVDSECKVDPASVVECQDSSAECMVNECEPKTGECEEVASDDGTVCDDGNICTEPDTCTNGECKGPDNYACADTNPCTMDTCDPIVGCVYENAEDGTPCDDDGSVCESGQCSSESDSCLPGQKRRCWVECAQEYPPECLAGNAALIMGIETCQGGQWGECSVEMGCSTLSKACVNASNTPTYYKCLDGTAKTGHMTCFKPLGIDCETSFYSGWGPGDCPHLCLGSGDACAVDGEERPCEVHCNNAGGPVKQGTQHCQSLCDNNKVWGMCDTAQACND